LGKKQKIRLFTERNNNGAKFIFLLFLFLLTDFKGIIR